MKEQTRGISYTCKVGLRKPNPRVPIGLLQILSEEQAAQVREYGHLVGYSSTCRHCPCTYSTECCHCGDGQVHST